MEYREKTKKPKRKGRRQFYSSSESDDEPKRTPQNSSIDDSGANTNTNQPPDNKVEDIVANDFEIVTPQITEKIQPQITLVNVKAFLYFLEPNIEPLFTDYHGNSIDHLAQITKLSENCLLVNFLVPENEIFTFKIRVSKSRFLFDSFSFENNFRQRDLKGIEGGCIYDIVTEKFDSRFGNNIVCKLHSPFHYLQVIYHLSSLIGLRGGDLFIFDEVSLNLLRLLRRQQVPYDNIFVKMDEIIKGTFFALLLLFLLFLM